MCVDYPTKEEIYKGGEKVKVINLHLMCSTSLWAKYLGKVVIITGSHTNAFGTTYDVRENTKKITYAGCFYHQSLERVQNATDDGAVCRTS